MLRTECRVWVGSFTDVLQYWRSVCVFAPTWLWIEFCLFVSWYGGKTVWLGFVFLPFYYYFKARDRDLLFRWMCWQLLRLIDWIVHDRNIRICLPNKPEMFFSQLFLHPIFSYAPPPPPPLANGSIPTRRLQTSIQPEMPSCVQNAMMTKDKKPFTYTPCGIDLSQIKSPRMAKRIQRNAQMEGVTNQPKPSPLAQVICHFRSPTHFREILK